MKIWTLFLAPLFCHGQIFAQTYSGLVTFGSSNQYSFDFVVECHDPPTSATLTVTFTTAPPPALVPQLHLGGGVFVPMSGSGPFTYDFSGLVDCDFSFSFWMAYSAGGLYQSPTPVTTGNTSLPIYLSSFTVEPYGNYVAELKWTSLTEINGDRFRVERSVDGINWDLVDEVSASGNSSGLIAYRYLDQDLPIGKDKSSLFYYRLKMIDLDGSYEYSDVRSVSFYGLLDNNFSIYPNPFRDHLFLNLANISLGSGNLELGIYNMDGKNMLYEPIIGTVRTINAIDLPSGIYAIVLFKNGEKIDQSRIIKVN